MFFFIGSLLFKGGLAPGGGENEFGESTVKLVKNLYCVGEQNVTHEDMTDNFQGFYY